MLLAASFVVMFGFQAAPAPSESELLSKLKNESLWRDPARSEALASALKQASFHSTPGVIEFLVDRIDYDTYSLPGARTTKFVSVEKRFLVCGALEDLGVKAVPALVAMLKKTDPNEREGNGAQRRTLGIITLKGIYDAGGHGRELALERLRLELAKAKGVEKELLQKAMDHALLK